MAKDTSRLTSDDWILAGFRALVASGPNALKAEPLARALGATKGSFYWHFKDVSEFHARMADYWLTHAYAEVARQVDAGGTPIERLHMLGEISTTPDEAYGGVAAEPAIRAWAQSNPTVANAVAEIDAKRLTYLTGLLAELGLTNPDFARIIYGAYIGMDTLSATDGVKNVGAMSTLMAAILALQEA